MCCGCDTSYIALIHTQCQTSIFTLSLCCEHSWRVRLAKQEMLTPPGHLVSPLVCRGPWMSTLVNANNVAERLRKMSIRFSVVIHTYNVLSHLWDSISSGIRGPVTSVSLHLVILKDIISIKTYSPMHKKIVNTCSHSNITVWVCILNIV